MTHEDIYTKFMIEYDKANVLSSYPSLTEYEVATFLDKAYNALIAQKITGNNVRRMGFETDVKVIEDLSPLIVQDSYRLIDPHDSSISEKAVYSKNLTYIELPEDQLYFVSAFLTKNMLDCGNEIPMDGHVTRALPILLISHQMAKKFRSNAYNKPWIKSPVGYIEDNKLFIMYDELTTPISTINDPYGQKISHARCFLVYVRKPNEFVKDLRDTVKFGSNTGVYTYFKPSDNDPDNEYYKFECNSSMAEELISLAIAYALENVESARLTAKLNMRGLES